ncbi:hypothetical protein MXB_1188 [Myxobolus squamalis]|nr:hypothetical protein MXB_1188 [Myxobolus squamalis]
MVTKKNVDKNSNPFIEHKENYSRNSTPNISIAHNHHFSSAYGCIKMKDDDLIISNDPIIADIEANQK